MECAYHPDRAVAGYCNQCGKAVCAECFRPHGDNRLCPVCAAAAPKPPANTTLVVLGVIAGVLFVCLIVVLIFAGLRYRGWREQALVPPPPALEDELLLPGEEEPPQEPATPEPSAPLPPGGERAAVRAALEDRPNWVGTVNWHSRDWSEARVWIGPSREDPRLSRALWWNPAEGRYEIMHEGPVERPRPERPAARPGRSLAEQAVLEQEEPGWVVRVVHNSSDWRKVTLWSGPPQSEFAYEYRLEWDESLGQYVTVHVGALPPVGE